MKKCNHCGSELEDSVKFCLFCGSDNHTPTTNDVNIDQTQSPDVTPIQPTATVESGGNGNIVAGIVGAFLFSLIGALFYFVMFQLEIIAGVAGLLMFVLANFGYRLFAQTKNKACIPALVVSFIFMLIMIFIAEYVSVSYILYGELKGYGFTFFETVKITHEFISDPEVMPDFIKDLAFAYIFGIIGCISNIVEIVKANKKQASYPAK